MFNFRRRLEIQKRNLHQPFQGGVGIGANLSQIHKRRHETFIATGSKLA